MLTGGRSLGRHQSQRGGHQGPEWYEKLLRVGFTENGHADLWEVLATQAIANVVKSSFGPSGLDKMMVDDIGVRGNLAMPSSAHSPIGCHSH